MSYQLKQLTPSLWVGQSRMYQMNSGVFLSGAQACLIDPGMYPDELEAIAAFVAARGATALALVVTHSHWDHILGPAYFPGVPVIAQALLPQLAVERKDETLAEINNWIAQQAVPYKQPFTLPAPDRVFEDATSLQVGSLSLRLVHAPGHCPDQVVVFEAASGALWAADMLSDIEIPGLDNSIAVYEQTLAMLAGWPINILVPGHGAPTADRQEIQTRILRDRAYLARLSKLLQRSIDRGDTLDQAQAACATLGYRIPGESQHDIEFNDEVHKSNVEEEYKKRLLPTR